MLSTSLHATTGGRALNIRYRKWPKDLGGLRFGSMVKLVDELREQVENVMRQRGVVRASVFGSVARGEDTSDSDIDFLVEFEKGRTLLDLSGLRLDLSETLEREVDVATPNSLHPEMKERILAEQVRIL